LGLTKRRSRLAARIRSFFGWLVVAPRGSRLIGQLNKFASIQIALRLPEPDLAKAREVAARKVIGYQTLLNMLVHREARRA
jgi:hypothetical protein